MNARDAALSALVDCRVKDAWSDAVLKKHQASLEPRDAALCSALCYGVLQNRALLDYYIDLFLTGKKKLPPMLRDILRLAVYQLVFLDRVPDSAAVNEAVNQAKTRLGRREANLCNGVLRTMLRSREKLTPPADYAIRYSHPPELVDLMKESVGKRLGAILAADNTAPALCAQWNPLKGPEEALLAAWRREGVTAAPHPWLPHGWLLRGTGDPEKLPSFQTGLFQIQDAAARLSVLTLELRPGDRVLDLCAAPGGKSMAAAAYMENRGEILSCDLHEKKLPRIEAAAKRLGVTVVTALQNDAAAPRPEWTRCFDAVIADVPCSGLGVIRKKPDIRYKSLESMEALPALQARILSQAGAYVKPGGQLLYSTCTILRRENEDVVRAFLASRPEFRPEALSLPGPLSEQAPGMITLYQGVNDCDGFFLCRMRKEGIAP